MNSSTRGGNWQLFIAWVVKKTAHFKMVDYLVTALSILLAVTFVGGAIYKVVNYSGTAEQFERFGYEPWFVWVTVLVELTAGVLVLIPHPQTRSWGTTLIIVTMIAAMLSHLKADEPREMIPPLVVMIMAMVVAWYGPLKPSDAELAKKEKERRERHPATAQDIVKQCAGFVLMLVSGYLALVGAMGRSFFTNNRMLNIFTVSIFLALAFVGYFFFSAKPAPVESNEVNKNAKGSN